MEITEVKVFPIQEEKLKAFVSIVFDQCFMVNDIKIIQGRDGLFISMPSRKKKNGEFKDVAHPLNNETRRVIEEKVLAEYDRALEERGEAPADRGERAQRVPLAVVPGMPAAPAMPAEPGRADEAPHAIAAAPDQSLEEVEELHLRDSFWTV
jgi:stage V sporulation protein G